MESESSLLLDVAVAFGVALAGGFLATRLRLPAFAGYIAAGLVISPFTPGFVGDIERLRLIADIGVVLLLFAIGVQFTIADLFAAGVRGVVLAVAATALVIGAALLMAPLLGWSWEQGAYAGAASSIASSVVIVTLLERRGEIATDHGRTVVGFTVMQDLLAVVLIIVLETVTEAGGDASGIAREALVAAGGAVAFVAGALIVGTRVVPFVLNRIAEERSRELFFLAIAALVIGTALASEYVGLSLALGAFLAGIVVSESDLSHRVLGELLPVRDVFAVLFFVTAGMLVDPVAVVEEWPALLAVFFFMAILKPVVAGVLLLLMQVRLITSLLTAAFVLPSAEFTFLLAGSGLDAGVVSEELFSAIITAAVLSIAFAPLAIWAAEFAVERLRRQPALEQQPDLQPSRLGHRAIICGYNEVGAVVATILRQRFETLVIEEDPRRARAARYGGLDVVEGSPISPAVLEHAGIEDARVVVIALEDPFATRLFAERARQRNPYVDIVAHARLAGEAEKLHRSGVAEAVVAENEVAFELARHGLHRFGLSARESLAVIQQYRARLRLAD